MMMMDMRAIVTAVQVMVRNAQNVGTIQSYLC